jgi:hypothetical protein
MSSQALRKRFNGKGDRFCSIISKIKKTHQADS